MMTVIWFIDDSIVGHSIAQDLFDVIFAKQSAINLNVLNVMVGFEQASQTELGFKQANRKRHRKNNRICIRDALKEMALNNNNKN